MAECPYNKPVLYILIFLFLPFLLNAERSFSYRFHTMPETSYYGGIHSIAKDSIGRIWFSGSEAVFIYDGVDFIKMNDRVTVFSPESNWSYTQVAADSEGRLYVGTSRGLLRYDYLTDGFDFVIDGNVSMLASSSDGNIWMIRNDCPESFSADVAEPFKSYPLPEDISGSSSAVFLSCCGDRVYVSKGNSVYRLSPETSGYVHAASVRSASDVKEVLEYNGFLYVMTSTDGVFKVDGTGVTVRHFPVYENARKAIVAKDICLDSRGIVWVATQYGIILINPETDMSERIVANIHYPYSLPNNSVWYVYQEPDGSGVWVGTYGGKLALMDFSDDGVNWFKASPGGLNHSIVSCFAEEANGNLWIGTEGNGVNYWDRKNNEFVYYTDENGSGLSSSMIKKLSYEADSLLVVSTFNGGMRYYDRRSGSFRKFTDFTSPSIVYDFLYEGKDGIWVSDPDSDIVYIDLISGTLEKFAFRDSFLENRKLKVQTMFHNKAGNLCLVTSSGCYVVEPRSRRLVSHHYIENASFIKNNLTSYCMASDGMTWFGTRGAGINVLDADGAYSAFVDVNGSGLDDKTIFGILENDATGDIWFSTDAGLYYLDKGRNEIQKSKIDIPNLCGAYYIRSCFKTCEGEMLFGGTDGFILFDPAKIKVNDRKPDVFFTSLKINNKETLPGDGGSPLKRSVASMSRGKTELITLSSKMANFEVSFSSDSYLKAEKNQFMYRLSGQSDEWSVLPVGQRSVRFFSLGSGFYTLEVRAANNDGVWGDHVAALRFRVKSHPLYSWWAILLYAAAVIGAVVWGFYYFRNKRLYEEKLQDTRTKLDDLYKKKYVPGPSGIVVNDENDALMKKAMELVEKNMDNSEYDVAAFVSDMTLGRTVLYQKLHEITGMSVKEFILDIRLKRAEQLLKESEYTVSEISYMTGFINPKYFSTVFKKKFGHSPSENR